MRDENDSNALFGDAREFLIDLRHMLVFEKFVRFERFVDLGEKQIFRCFASGSRDTAFRVDRDRWLGSNQR